MEIPSIRTSFADLYINNNFMGVYVVTEHIDDEFIKKNYEPVIHCGKIAQTAVIEDIDNECLRTGDKGLVKFCFKYRPEFIEKDDILIFREGKTKGIGKILELGI